MLRIRTLAAAAAVSAALFASAVPASAGTYTYGGIVGAGSAT